MNQHKPSLLLVADTYYPKVDGVLMFMQEFMKRARDDFQLTAMVPKFSTVQKWDSVHYIFLQLSRRMRAFTYDSIDFSFENRHRIKHAVQKADIIFVQELGPVGLLALRYARKYDKKVVLYIHNTPWEFISKYYSLSRFTRAVLRRFFVSQYNNADLLLVPYQGFQHELMEAGVKTEMKVARLGVDISRFVPVKNKEEVRKKLHLPHKRIIGYVGRVSPEKNMARLLEAFKRIRQENILLLIVGDGVPELVTKFKENPRCMVTGFVSNVNEYLQAMDIFVMPSLTETTSLATLEAMATGLPVVASKVGFMKSYIVKNHNGVFFPRNSPAILASQIERLLKDKNLRQHLGENARKMVAYSFSWERSINKMKRLLLQV